ncbi:MAG: urate hydroxylase PuuD [Kofleriaceae bacterium]
MQLSELLDVIFRWAHVIAGIMWIGNSMLFNWIDRNLEKSAQLSRLSQGKIYMLHSGAFYDVEKKLLEPGEMPETLHWFKWQNFTTWSTGICLLVIVYYFHGAAFLVDPSVHDVGPAIAITLSVSALFIGWLTYDALWRTLGETHPRAASLLSVVFLFGAIWAFTLVFSGRAAYIETGVLVGTIMTGNVWFVIVPSQHALVAATVAGKAQDPKLSVQAKARSIHNNYLTYPLIFIMISNHFSAATTHHLNWLILIVVCIGGAAVRYFMNVRYLGGGKQRATSAWLAPAFVSGAVVIAGLMVLTRIDKKPRYGIDHAVSFARVQEIIGVRCVPCHSQKPSDDTFHAPPLGMMLDTPEQIHTMAPRIKYRAYDLANMPFNNKTKITDHERAELATWVDDGAHTN